MNTPAVTRLLMRICAARLDAAVSYGEFVQLLERLLDHVATVEVPAATDRIRSDPFERVDGGESETSVARVARQAEDAPPREPLPPAKKPPERRLCSLMYADQREKVQALARMARDEEGNYPEGFIAGLADEYHVAEEVIEHVIEHGTTGPKRRGLSYDDRVRIRMRAEEAKGDGTRYPKGFIPGLASEYHVSEQTIRNALKGEQ